MKGEGSDSFAFIVSIVPKLFPILRSFVGGATPELFGLPSQGPYFHAPLGDSTSFPASHHVKPTSPETAEEELLTALEVARRYKVTTRTVLNWEARKLVPAIRIGKIVRFRLSEVIKAVEGEK